MKDLALTPEILLQGYASGVFPMAEGRDDPEVFWVDPKRRGVMPLKGFHMSRSLARRSWVDGFFIANIPENCPWHRMKRMIIQIL